MEIERIVAVVLVGKPLEPVWGHWMDRRDTEGVGSRQNYEKVIPFQLIGYVFADGRRGCVEFQHIDRNTIVRESFEPDPALPPDMQRASCQARLDRFKEELERL